jgi:hypothetical protein
VLAHHVQLGVELVEVVGRERWFVWGRHGSEGLCLWRVSGLSLRA